MSQRDSFRIGVAVVALVAALAAGCGGDDESANTGGSGGTGDSAAEIRRGGDLVIARTQESLSMDKTSVFDNESIWIFQQMFETLYTVAEDGQDVKPWLAESYELSEDQKTYTFHLRKGVKFHNGQEMTSADVKFSLDDATSTKGGWEFINVAIKSVEAPDPYTVVVTTKYKWAPLLADIALFSNAIIPKDWAGMTEKEFYEK